MAKRDIVVVGGSAGSAIPLRQLIDGLPRDYPGSLFITTHISSTRPSFLAEMLSRSSSIRVSEALDGQPIQPGHAYVASTDRHLLLQEGTLRLGVGPRENMCRPSIDPMFRSAALTFGPRAVGVILSGMLNDGASGLHAIQQAGGTTIVQHPLDAHEESMPRAALEAVQSDHVVTGLELPGLLMRLAGTDAGPQQAVSDTLAFEVDVAAGNRGGSEQLGRYADPATLTCPECQGVLSEVRGELPLRYRCQIGHAYTAEQLAVKHERVDEALRLALRLMEERLHLVTRMAREARDGGRLAVAELYELRAEEYRSYAETLREAALSTLHLPAEREVTE